MSVRTNAGFLDAVPVGSGMDWYTDTAPDNWMLCQGQAISRTEYAELFKILGTVYGTGDGATTFNLPDFRGKTGVGKDASTFSKLGSKVGSETNKLTIANIPPHTHNYAYHTVRYARIDPDTTTGDGREPDYNSTPKATSSVGNGASFSIVQPSLVINKIIKVK